VSEVCSRSFLHPLGDACGCSFTSSSILSLVTSRIFLAWSYMDPWVKA
jgi:hypothetical protein